MFEEKKKIVETMYKVFLFRSPSEKEINSKVFSFDEESLADFISRNSYAMISSPEKTKKITRDPFRRVEKIDKESLSFVLYRLSHFLYSDYDPTVLFFLEVKLVLEGIGDNDSVLMYEKLSKSKNKNISTISQARLIQNKNESGSSSFIHKRNFIKNLAADVSIESFFRKEKKMAGELLEGTELSRHREGVLASPDVLSDALGSHVIKKNGSYTDRELVDIARSACVLKNFSSQQIDKIIDIFKKGIARERPTFKYDVGSKVPCFIVGGFLFSGSSAIYDFFRGLYFSRTIKNKGREVEIPLVANYYNSFIKETSREKFISFYFKNLLNIFLPESNNNVNLRKRDFSFYERSRLGGEKELDFYVDEIVKLLFGAISRDSSIQKESLLNFLLSFSSSNGDPKEFLILNQSPVVNAVQAINAFPLGASYLAVYRDPRDQYVDQVNHGAIRNGVYEDVYGFIEKYKEDRLGFFSKKEKHCDSYSVFEVSFEEFVSSEEERKRVCEALDIDYEEGSQFFNPRESEKNIGMYERWHNQSEIREIEKHLPEYLWRH